MHCSTFLPLLCPFYVVNKHFPLSIGKKVIKFNKVICRIIKQCKIYLTLLFILSFLRLAIQFLQVYMTINQKTNLNFTFVVIENNTKKSLWPRNKKCLLYSKNIINSQVLFQVSLVCSLYNLLYCISTVCFS